MGEDGGVFGIIGVFVLFKVCFKYFGSDFGNKRFFEYFWFFFDDLLKILIKDFFMIGVKILLVFLWFFEIVLWLFVFIFVKVLVSVWLIRLLLNFKIIFFVKGDISDFFFVFVMLFLLIEE